MITRIGVATVYLLKTVAAAVRVINSMWHDVVLNVIIIVLIWLAVFSTKGHGE